MKQTIAIIGNDPRGYSGFGRIVNYLVDSVLEAGHTPIVIACKPNNLREFTRAQLYETTPSDIHGLLKLEEVVRSDNPSVVISIGDPWDVEGIGNIHKAHDFIWIGYTPVDSTPYPRYVLLTKDPHQYLDVGYVLRHMDHIVTYSDFGKAAALSMLEETYDPSLGGKPIPPLTRIYLGVDSEFFSPGSRAEARHVFSGAITEDDLLFTSMKVNSLRSGLDTLLEAWSIFMRKAKRDSSITASRKLYIHTSAQGAYSLPLLMQRYGVQESVFFNPELTSQSGVSELDIRDVYRSSDLALSAVRAEGFGLNVLEAMSCGVPAIIPDYGGPSEYGKDGVARASIAATYNPEFAVTDFAIVNTEEMANEMLRLAKNEDDRTSMGKRAREIAKELSWDCFVSEWAKLINNHV